MNIVFKLIYSLNAYAIKNQEIIPMKIPGLSFSWKRAIGITQAKQKIARATGIPTTKQGLERKIGNTIFKGITKLIK